MTRPLVAQSIFWLEESVQRNQSDRAELEIIKQELAHRSARRAKDLAGRVTVLIDKLESNRDADLVDSTVGDKIIREHEMPEPDSQVLNDTSIAVAKLRARLIDLTRKSPLINFRHGGRSASILRVVDERPDLIFEEINRSGVGFEPLPDADATPKDEKTDEFRIAYERGRLVDTEFLEATDDLGDHEDDADALQAAERALRMRIRDQLGLPRLDYGKALDIKALAKSNGVDPSFDLRTSDDQIEAHHEDDLLRVLLTEKELQKRLKSIWDKYRSHYRETGIHTLYLAFGFVEWQDEASSSNNHSPILLLAVELHREVKRSKYEYKLRPHDEGLQLNTALAEKMREHWGLKMPQLRDEESPESYFVRLRKVLQEGHDLSLRQFVTLAVLPFPQMVLWKDLDPEKWGEDAFGLHRLLPGLMGAAPVSEGRLLDATIDIDSPEWSDQLPALISPADASQHSALIEAAHDYDLAIEGPPGTGKSQTITNMIADAVSRGRKVLFVAEKQAALQVVANRLREAGLGPLILELHGENANRAAVYDGLRERLNTVSNSDERQLALQRGRLKERRNQIRGYLSELHRTVGSSGKTVYELVWREIALRRRVAADLQKALAELVHCTDPMSISQVELDRIRSTLDIFGQSLSSVRSEGENYWLHATTLPVFDQSEAIQIAAKAQVAAANLTARIAQLLAIAEVSVPTPEQDIDATIDQAKNFKAFTDVSEPEAVAALRAPDQARSAMRLQVRWRMLRDRLAEDVSNPSECDREAVEALSTALSQLTNVPETLRELKAALQTSERLAHEVSAAEKSTDSLRKILQLPLGLPVDGIVITGTVFRDLGDHSPTVKALLHPDLLDPINELAIAEQSAAAQAIGDRRSQLAEEVIEDIFSADPSELRELASVLEESGFFARVFGGGFKRAKRRSAQLLRDAAERNSAAVKLREAAEHLKSAKEFREESEVKGLFPPVLWKGHETDFASLETARGEVKSARLKLGDLQLEGLLDEWFNLDAQSRDKVARLATQFVGTVSELAEMVDPKADMQSAKASICAMRDALSSASSLLAKIGVLEEAFIVRNGETLPVRIQMLEGCESEFHELVRREELSWIKHVSWSLDGLGRAIEHATSIRNEDDPLNLASVLGRSAAPARLSDELATQLRRLTDAALVWKEYTSELETSTGVVATRSAGEASADVLTQWKSVDDRLLHLAEDANGARQAAKLLNDRADLSDLGLGGLCDAGMNGRAQPDEFADAYELAVVSRSLHNFLKAEGTEIERTGGLNLADARKMFVKIDKELHELEAQAILAKRLNDQMEYGIGHGRRGNFTEMALLNNELGLKRPRTPLRDVVNRAGSALQTLQPIWMMSPSSAAQYIQPGSAKFDVLIVDEASQMRPEFAVSAIMRADQFVVVGDANQLPPSNHFAARNQLDEDDDSVGVDADAESILDVANQKFRRKRRLKWHYRSRHESLIQFSNREFYDGDLVVFPSPSGDEDDLLGAKIAYVPDQKPGTYYEASINQKEAEAVLEEALHLMTNYPDYSLGIAAMNAQQAQLLNLEFDRLRLEHKGINAYIDAYSDTVEEFFIKNLENVQGDERDIILVSTVYGPDRNGVVKQHFGLMNQEVGWRRLNVLVTRAKSLIKVFTSLRPGDVKVTPTSSRGIKAFNAYLSYLHHHAVVDQESVGEAESDFEWVVAERLRNEGYICISQVGVNNFRIDIGVKHEECGDAFIAGIECDGAPYHSGFTVRDRDRIRQQVLEGLNWKIYRIWSVDWYQDADREMQKLLDWLARARKELSGIRQTKPIDVDLSLASPNATKEASSAYAIAEDAVEVLEPVEPVGRRLQPIDGIEWYETKKGLLYSVWEDSSLKGDVSVLSRATSAPKLYGDRVSVQKSEYEARVAATGERRAFHDLYAAIRFIGGV